MASTPAKRPTDAKPPSTLPLFYHRPVPVSPDAFKGKSLVATPRRAFARKTNLVPLNTTEFALAQRHYPIVFSLEGQHFPMAIVGVRNDENLFVGSDGQWRAETYVPAYVRRYPFILMGKPGNKQFALCADMASSDVVDGDANPFFRDGKPAEAVKQAAAFCRTFQAEADKTNEFCAALLEQNLLQAKAAELTHPSGRKLKLGPFRLVDERKFAGLAGKIVTDWHARGWLRLVHAHLFSLANWNSLAARLSLH